MTKLVLYVRPSKLCIQFSKPCSVLCHYNNSDSMKTINDHLHVHINCLARRSVANSIHNHTLNAICTAVAGMHGLIYLQFNYKMCLYTTQYKQHDICLTLPAHCAQYTWWCYSGTPLKGHSSTADTHNKTDT